MPESKIVEKVRYFFSRLYLRDEYVLAILE